METSATQSRLANPGRRLSAWLLDAALSGVLIIPILPLMFTVDNEETSFALLLIITGIPTLAAFALLVLFDGGERGATPGKRMLGIRVADRDGGGPIGLRRAALRRLVYMIGGLLLYIGWLWLLIDRDRQTWHDKAARTLVIRTHRSRH
jgi:uncharacterized RDD family membrane protein YckC